VTFGRGYSPSIPRMGFGWDTGQSLSTGDEILRSLWELRMTFGREDFFPEQTKSGLWVGHRAITQPRGGDSSSLKERQLLRMTIKTYGTSLYILLNLKIAMSLKSGQRKLLPFLEAIHVEFDLRN
jgi:hypothetical protein